MDDVTFYHYLKDSLSHSMGISHQVLHIHAGLAIYLACQIASGTRRASGLALGIVFGFEVANETLDWSFHGVLLTTDTFQDFVGTTFWPCVLYLTGRYRRQRWRAESQRRLRLRQTFAMLHSGPARLVTSAD